MYRFIIWLWCAWYTNILLCMYSFMALCWRTRACSSGTSGAVCGHYKGQVKSSADELQNCSQTQGGRKWRPDWCLHCFSLTSPETQASVKKKGPAADQSPTQKQPTAIPKVTLAHGFVRRRSTASQWRITDIQSSHTMIHSKWLHQFQQSPMSRN